MCIYDCPVNIQGNTIYRKHKLTHSVFLYARKNELPDYVSLQCKNEMQCSTDMGENSWEKCNEMPSMT